MSDVNYQWNKILVTGAGGGLGLALVKYFVSKGKKVVLAGRTESNLKAAVESISSADVSYVVVDLAKLSELPTFVASLLKQHPDLDAVLNNAGIQKSIDYATTSTANVASNVADGSAEVTTNISAVLDLTTLLLPHLLAQPKAAVMTISSGLAFIPMKSVPVYCATKAFIHYWSISLRLQLAQTNVRVIEIAPPLVESDLHRDHANSGDYTSAKMANCMSQADFIAGVDKQMIDGKEEIAVGFAGVGSQKWHDAFDSAVKMLNP